MRIKFDKLRLKQDIDRVELLHWGHFFLVLLGLIVEVINGFWGLGLLIALPLILMLYRLFFKTARELYYTFWTFSFFAIIYFFAGLIHSFGDEGVFGLFYIYFLALILLSVEMYILSSPIYYPQVNWWEYDFRYRHDLKVKASNDESNVVNGRVTDLRREAGCLTFFEDFKIGEVLKVESTGEANKISLKAEVVSKRRYSLGRPINYGVRFILDDHESRKEYETITKLWESGKKHLMDKKFEALKDS